MGCKGAQCRKMLWRRRAGCASRSVYALCLFGQWHKDGATAFDDRAAGTQHAKEDTGMSQANWRSADPRWRAELTANPCNATVLVEIRNKLIRPIARQAVAG